MKRSWLLLGLLCAGTVPSPAQDPGPSLEELGARVDQAPNDVSAVRALARMHLARGETNQALSLATRLLELAHEDPADRLLLARASLAEAERVGNQALGRGYRQSLLMDAEQSARLAARSERLRDEAELFLAHVLMRRDDPTKVMALLTRLLDRISESPDLSRSPHLVGALALRGYLTLIGPDPQAALADLERAIFLAPDREDLRKQRALALSHRSMAEAEEALLELLERGAVDLGSSVHQILGTVPERASRVLRALTERWPDDSRAWYWRGRSEILAGRFQEAMASFDRTLQIVPGDHSTLAFRADARGRAGDLEGMVLDLIEVVRSGSNDAAWAERRLLDSATWQAEQGRWEEMVRVSGVLIEKGASEAAYGNRALALRWLDRMEESEQTYLEALELFPDDPRLINDYGLMLEGVGRSTEAAERFEQAAAMASLDGLENLGILRLKQGDRSAARLVLRMVLEQEPGRLRSLAGYADLLLSELSSSR